MKEVEVTLNLPEGNFITTVNIFDEDDHGKILDIYKNWSELNKSLKEVNARGSNLPEGLSEVSLCLVKGFYRKIKNINGANATFDCYDPNSPVNSNRIQVKACSVIPDLSSFGPKSVWDRLFFMDFYANGNWDGEFVVYEIGNEDINTHMVSSTQTFQEQKDQGRRPRFSIMSDFVKENKFVSKDVYKITEEGILKIE